MFFMEDINESYGSLIIEGLQVNHDCFDPIAKIWSAIRKKNFKKFGVDATGIFTYVESDMIVCKFYLNYGVNDAEADIVAYGAKFQKTFIEQMQELNYALRLFIEDTEHGLEAYNKKAPKAYFEELDEFLDVFLEKHSFKKRKRQK